MSMNEVLAKTPSADSPSGRASGRVSKPGREVASSRGGELVTLHGHDAAAAVANWKAGLERAGGDARWIRGRLEIDLIKGVRGILAENPRCDEHALVAALNEYMTNGNHPNYLPHAFRKVQQARAKAANPQFQETPREQMERGFYEQQLARHGQDVPEGAPLEAAKTQYWSTVLSDVKPSSTVSNTLWCDRCDPDNPGWLPRDVDEAGREFGPVRKCDCRKQRETSRQKVRAAADGFYAEHFESFYGSGRDGVDVLDAELVDESPTTTDTFGF